MSDESPMPRPFVRAGVEFFVIVVSILAAFALDALWDSRVEHRQVVTRLQALETELEATREYIAYQKGKLEAARGAVAILLAHVSPQAPVLAPDSLNSLIELSFELESIEVQGRAPQTMQSAGEFAALEDADLTRLLASWPITAAELRTRSGLLEENRELILDYLHASYPTLDIAHETGMMGRYPRSSFEASPLAVQRDLRVEGLFGNRGMLIEDTDQRLDRLDELATDLLTLVRGSR